MPEPKIKPNVWRDGEGHEHVETCSGYGCPIVSQCGRYDERLKASPRGHRRNEDKLWECEHFAFPEDIPWDDWQL